jgi:hypothetical protein
MRLAAQAKLGYYPASPLAIGELLKHLRVVPPDPARKSDATNVIDPCSGEGAAIHQIATGLGVAEEHVHAVELDKGRSDKARELMPRHRHIGPASFIGSMITGHSMGLAYVNPPFDNELGGGRREEQTFATRATHLLVPRGILVLVCPLRALVGNRTATTRTRASTSSPTATTPRPASRFGPTTRSSSSAASGGKSCRSTPPRSTASCTR